MKFHVRCLVGLNCIWALSGCGSSDQPGSSDVQTSELAFSASLSQTESGFEFRVFAFDLGANSSVLSPSPFGETVRISGGDELSIKLPDGETVAPAYKDGAAYFELPLNALPGEFEMTLVRAGSDEANISNLFSVPALFVASAIEDISLSSADGQIRLAWGLFDQSGEVVEEPTIATIVSLEECVDEQPRGSLIRLSDATQNPDQRGASPPLDIRYFDVRADSFPPLSVGCSVTLIFPTSGLDLIDERYDSRLGNSAVPTLGDVSFSGGDQVESTFFVRQ